MNLASRHWLSALLFTVLALLPSSACAGMTPEEVKAFESVKAKAEKGDVDAQYNLGNYYREGIGVARDFPKAVSWFRKPAELGDARAQYSLGNCYITHPLPPFGGVECFEEEVKFSRIVEKYPRVKVSPEDRRRKVYPIMNGEYELGPVEYFEPIMLEYAQEVRAAGVKWYRKAAEQGHTEAQFSLGVCYGKGRGVAKDEIEAYAYYNLAGITDEDARNNLTLLENKMSRDEVAAAQKRTKELQKEIEAKIAAKKGGK